MIGVDASAIVKSQASVWHTLIIPFVVTVTYALSAEVYNNSDVMGVKKKFLFPWMNSITSILTEGPFNPPPFTFNKGTSPVYFMNLIK